jgi:hypothetical protein
MAAKARVAFLARFNSVEYVEVMSILPLQTKSVDDCRQCAHRTAQSLLQA